VTNPVLRIVIGSTRPGRVGPAVGNWITQRAVEHGGFDVRVTDLAELNLPLLDEAEHPRLQKYTNQHTLDWSALVGSSEAFVFVIPEYNHSFNAATKNALDYLNAEWANKAVALVSYGGVAAGTRAVQALKPVLISLKMLPVNEGVNIPFVREHIDAEGRFKPTEIEEASARIMFDELARVTRILRAA
jgi:NAD(P)H-dependent FMN reductase